MSDFIATYEITRGRFTDAITKLSHAQLNFRQNPNTLTAAEMALHVAGIEVSYASQLFESNLNAEDELLARCATEGSINDLPFPVPAEELTPDRVAKDLERGRAAAMSLFESADPNIRAKVVPSALGPLMNGQGAMARLCSHAFYHLGQVYMIAQSPDYPA